MGWDLEPDVLEDADLTDVNIRKFRYGLMGPDPSIWDDGSVDQNNELSRYLGNVYFGFVEDPTVTGSEPSFSPAIFRFGFHFAASISSEPGSLPSGVQ